MKKIVIFTEGQGELIFIRTLLIYMINNNDLSFECLELRGGNEFNFPYTQKSETATIHFLIINVGNDERVISAINERGTKYTSQGIEIIGIRDMYSRAYKNQSSQIDQQVINDFRQSHQDSINQMNNCELIHFYFEIMELEAWFLAMYKLFERIDPTLTTEFIKINLDIDLENNDPEKTYFHPSIEVDKILQLVGKNYKKHQSEVSSIVGNITEADIHNMINKRFCDSFIMLHNEINREYLASLES